MQPIINYETGAILFRQLAAASRHGAPMRDVVQILGRDPELFGKDLPAIETLNQLFDDGEPLSAALAKLPELIAPETAALIRVSEQRGKLATVLDALADDYTARLQARSALTSALTWPAVLLSAIFLITAGAMIFVIPAFKDVYSSFGADLPAPTQALIEISDLFGEWWYLMIPAVAAPIYAYRRGTLPESLIDSAHRFVMAIGFVRNYLVSDFVAQLVAWLRIGIADPDLRSAALAHLRATVQVRPLRDCLDTLNRSLADGKLLGPALEGLPPLPLRLGLMVQLGEKMGNADAALAQFAELGTAGAEVTLARFERGLSAAIYVLFGITLGFIVIALYLPIFKLGSVIS